MQIRGGEERVVVEHLLEVGDEPALVDRVAVEAAADEVVHAAGRHPVEGLRDHLERASSAAGAEQELERRGRRELRRAAEAAVRGVELRRAGSTRRAIERARSSAARWTARARSPRGSPRRAVGLPLELVRAARGTPPTIASEDLLEARHVEARLRREVRPAAERLARRA